MKARIKDFISGKMGELMEVCKFLYENPEISSLEFKAAKLLSDKLEQNGFFVQRGIHSLDTAFRAEYDSGKAGPVIALFCEYDALPEIGHGCGHNLISAMSLGAALSLRPAFDAMGGKLVVFGTPAEETNGAKVKMTDEGAFEGIDAAMMVHPNPVTEASGGSLAMDALEFRFTGKTAHAATSPEMGINALDAVILLFNGVNALRQHVTSDVRIHGIISKGGEAPNIVPDYAEARFYIRARKRNTVDDVVKKVKNCAHGAELMTGAKVSISNFEYSFDNLITNRTMSEIFNKNLKELGETEIGEAKTMSASIDIANVSHVVPCIHPWIGFGDRNLALHTREFAVNTLAECGRQALHRGACAMAMTVVDILESEDIRRAIREEFALSKSM